MKLSQVPLFIAATACLALPSAAAKPGSKLQVSGCKTEASEHWTLPA